MQTSNYCRSQRGSTIRIPPHQAPRSSALAVCVLSLSLYACLVADMFAQTLFAIRSCNGKNRMKTFCCLLMVGDVFLALPARPTAVFQVDLHCSLDKRPQTLTEIPTRPLSHTHRAFKKHLASAAQKPSTQTQINKSSSEGWCHNESHEGRDTERQ